MKGDLLVNLCQSNSKIRHFLNLWVHLGPLNCQKPQTLFFLLLLKALLNKWTSPLSKIDKISLRTIENQRTKIQKTGSIKVIKYQKGLKNKNKATTLVLAETLLIDIFRSSFSPFRFLFLPSSQTYNRCQLRQKKIVCRYCVE